MPAYIDCGANLGQGYRSMKDRLKIDDSWSVVLIEPNAVCVESLKLQYPEAITIEAAIHTKEEKVPFNVAYCRKEEDWVGGESNILQEGFLGWEEYFKDYNKETTNYFEMNAVDVDTIVLEKLILDLDLDDIYLKVDIEGSEFEVLEQLVLSPVINRIRYVAVEWHDRFFDYNKTMYEKRRLVEQKFSDTPDLKYEVWH